MARFKWIAVATTTSLIVALMGQPASATNSAANSAAALTVSPKAIATVEIAFGSCTEHVVVYTQADLSPLARHTEVTVTPMGFADFHDFPGGTTKDEYIFQTPVSGFKPGTTVPVDVRWQAHNGNGLSMAVATAHTSVDIPSSGLPHKLSLASKCKMEDQAKDAAARAARQRDAEDRANVAGDTARALVWDQLAATNERLAYELHKMALDPPDPNFTTLPTANPPVVTPIVAAPGISADAATALNDLQHLMTDSIGQATAALSAVERAQGARQASDTTWEKNQSLAAAGFLKSLADKITGLPAAAKTAGERLKAGGFDNTAITAADLAAAVGKYLTSGPSNVDWFHQAGLTDADLQQVGALLATSGERLTNPLPILDTFSQPDLADRVNALVAVLNTEVATLNADPLVDHGNEFGVEPSPTPSVEPTPSPTTPEGASLLADSGFETPLVNKGDSYETLKAGTALGAWTIEKGSVDVVAASGGTAATGGQFIDLNGNATPDAGVISQKVRVNGAHKYRLTFQLAGNPNGDPPVKTVDVSLGDKTKSFSFNIKGHTNAKLGWTSYTLENSACGDSTMTVRFASTTKGQRGPNLDNVMLTDLGYGFCIPLWLMIAGGVVVLGIVAVVAWFWWRRRRSSTPAATETPASTETPTLIES